MNDCCATCGHDREEHLHGGRCERRLRCAGSLHWCTCRRFVPLGVALATRVAVVVLCVAVLGSLPGLVDLVVGGGAR